MSNFGEVKKDTIILPQHLYSIMVGENYINLRNLGKKSKEWLHQIEQYIHTNFQMDARASALLIIDLQNFFLDPTSHASLPAGRAILCNINKLLNLYRKYGFLIVFTKHALRENEDAGMMGKWWGDVIKECDEEGEIIPEFSPCAKEYIIRKTRYNAFYNTELEHILRANEIKSIVVTGVMTHLCCDTTAREAFVRDFEVYFVVDATATVNEELHLSSLRSLAHGFVVPVLTEQILKTVKVKL